MTRMILSLDEQDKSWLERQAFERGVSMAELVRAAIHAQRQKDDDSLDKLLAKTSGTWRSGDGLQYQRRSRAEWK